MTTDDFTTAAYDAAETADETWAGDDLGWEGFDFGIRWARTHLAGQEPTGAEAEAAARALNAAGWTCHEGGDNPGFYDECEDCRRVCDDLARAALAAARAVLAENGGAR